MTPRISPLLLFGFLVLLAVAVSGWLFGWHWRQVASGGKPTHDEKLIIQLQDQLDAARAENERLTGQLRSFEEGAEATEVPPSDVPVVE